MALTAFTTQSLLLFILIGGAQHRSSSAQEAGLPDCNLASLIECLNKAVLSYVVNTRGEEALGKPVDPATAIRVSTVLGKGIRNPQENLNDTCQVVRNVDMAGLVTCIEAVTQTCVLSTLPGNELGSDTLPSLRDDALPITDAVRLAPDLCAPECEAFPVAARHAAMLACWQTAEGALAMVAAGNLTRRQEQCSTVQDYASCQWNNSAGCTFLEETSRLHLTSLRPALRACDVQLPALFPPASNGVGAVSPSWLLALLSGLVSATTRLTGPLRDFSQRDHIP